MNVSNICTRIPSQGCENETHIAINFRITLYVTEPALTLVTIHYVQGSTHGEVSQELCRIPLRILGVTLLYFVSQL